MAKILENPSIPINSADIASQTTLLATQTTANNINNTTAQQSTLLAFQSSATTSLTQILAVLQPITGSNEITWIITDQSNNPVPGVKITVKNTTSAITLATTTVDINGQAILGLPSGTFNIFYYLPFYSFGAQPQVLTVTTNQTVPVTATSFQPVSANPNVCVLFSYLTDASGNPIVNEMVRAKLVSSFPYSPGTSMLASKNYIESFTDNTGFFELPLIQGGCYEISAPALYLTITDFVIPAQASLDLSTLLSRSS